MTSQPPGPPPPRPSGLPMALTDKNPGPTPPSSGKRSRGSRCRGPRGRGRCQSISRTASLDMTTDTDMDGSNIDNDEDALPEAVEYHAGTLADDVDNDDNLGLLAAALVPPPTGWTKESPKPKMSIAPSTNITRHKASTQRTFALALCYFYDDSTRFALRWQNTNMSHPIDGQRPGKRPGPSNGGKIHMLTVATWMVFHFSIHNYWDNIIKEARLTLSYVRLTDEGVFYCLCTMTPHQRSSCFQADFDQHGDIRTSRIPLDPPMIIWANNLPWFPVYKAFYDLCGSWNTASYLVGRKYRSSVSEFFLGYALAPPDAVKAAREDSLNELTLRTFDSAQYPNPEKTNGPVDLIHVATIARGRTKSPAASSCRRILRLT